MSADQGENGSGKKRQAGGFALVEVNKDTGDLEILAGGMPGQKECRAHLVELVQAGKIKADGKREFGIVQIKVTGLTPKLKPAQVTL